MVVCYFGAYDPEYPRNFIIRRGLEKSGVTITECRVSSNYRTIRRFQKLWTQYRKQPNSIRALIVAEFNHSVVPLAVWLARRKRIPLIFDPLVSFYDSLVLDRGIKHQPQATMYYWLDKMAFTVANYILTDTDANADFFSSTFGANRRKMFRIPVGARDDIFRPSGDQLGKDSLNVLFWGTYIPLHGVEYILRAAKILDQRNQKVEIQLVGRGQTYHSSRKLAEEWGLSNVRFWDPIKLQDLPEITAKANVCLGIFGHTLKAQRVVPTKVYAYLAMAKPTITGDSPAIREFFENGRHLITVPMADSDALAKAIIELRDDLELRKRVARQGYEIFQEQFSIQAVGKQVKEVLEQILS